MSFLSKRKLTITLLILSLITTFEGCSRTETSSPGAGEAERVAQDASPTSSREESAQEAAPEELKVYVDPNAAILEVIEEYEQRKKGDRTAEWETGIRERCFQIAIPNRGKQIAIMAMLFVADHWPNTDDSRRAYEMLVADSKSAAISEWVRAFNGHRERFKDVDYWQPLGRALVERVKSDLSLSEGAHLLAKMSSMVAPDSETDTEQPGDILPEIGELIVSHFATSPDLANFCEICGGTLGDAPLWSSQFESHMRQILIVNQDRFVRCSAKMALANIVRSGGLTRQSEALQLYEEFLKEFDGKTEYRASGIEEIYCVESQRHLDSLRLLGLGLAAPLIEGLDLEGKPLKLESYRGKVVLVSFWASWCGPCVKAIPHEAELLKRYGDRGFAILGVNGDEDIADAQKCAANQGVSWASLQIKDSAGKHIASQWHINAWPSFFLLDQQGVIQGRWQGLPPGSKLDEAIQKLLSR